MQRRALLLALAMCFTVVVGLTLFSSVMGRLWWAGMPPCLATPESCIGGQIAQARTNLIALIMTSLLLRTSTCNNNGSGQQRRSSEGTAAILAITHPPALSVQ